MKGEQMRTIKKLRRKTASTISFVECITLFSFHPLLCSLFEKPKLVWVSTTHSPEQSHVIENKFEMTLRTWVFVGMKMGMKLVYGKEKNMYIRGDS